MSTERRPNPSDPTAEGTSESSTPSASGLGGGRPDIEQAPRDNEPIPRGGEDARGTPRREDDPEPDPVMPTDDASLGTKI
jgi:hypothetical protein